MQFYVVDASVVIEYLVNDVNSDAARDYFGRITASDRLIVPEFCLLECTNVIWKRVRFDGMTRFEADRSLDMLRALKLNRTPMKHLLDKTLAIALNHSFAAYDSAYIALAQQFSCPLVTLDAKQGLVARNEGVALWPLIGSA